MTRLVGLQPSLDATAALGPSMDRLAAMRPSLDAVAALGDPMTSVARLQPVWQLSPISERRWTSWPRCDAHSSAWRIFKDP
jgi:hypothetical protein